MPKNVNHSVVLPVIAISGFLALACSGSRSEKVSSRGGGPTAASEQALSAPRPPDDLQLLRARVAGLEAELRMPAPAAPLVAATARAIEPSQELARRVVEPAMLQAHYDAVFATENPDKRWAPLEENAVAAVFSTDSAQGARLEKAECRESMCRIRVRFDDPGARSHFLAKIGVPPFDHGGFYRVDEATGAFTLYTAREGRTLPSVDPGPT